ncbi:MAG: phosphatidate cytidylyltransferase [Alcaligenaceae bacterium]|nr:MAG: phosphatidate cytidylyltransferase [Alcaligenaceae bacterium]
MLKQRLITALVLLGILALAVSATSPWPFLLFIALACACASFEWLRLTLGARSLWSGICALVLFGLTVWQTSVWLGGELKLSWGLKSVLVAAVLAWVLLLLPSLLRAQVTKPVERLRNSLAAVVILYATWAALAYWYLQRRAVFVVSLLIVIWVADIAAYFAGRAFGQHKLAPSISPGKTLEGALAGVVGVVVWLVVSAHWPQTFAAELLAQWSWAGLILAAVVLALFSIAGDLYESLLKRRAGVKDSSQLLPGHGGVYDRIDAVVAVVPLAFLLLEARTW